MGWPLSHLAEVMTAEEFNAHYADYRRNPWGPTRDNLHAALIAAEVANTAGKTLPQGVTKQVGDYMLKPNSPTDEPADDDDGFEAFAD